jgi:peptidoglycan lytic transglycosylase
MILRSLMCLTLPVAVSVGSTADAYAKQRAGGHHAGLASIYSYKGGRTASGERVHPSGLTAAHRSLPFGTKVKVTNRRNGKSVVVRINDRGPFIRGRIIDITPAAARSLGFSGLAPVTVEVMGRT